MARQRGAGVTRQAGGAQYDARLPGRGLLVHRLMPAHIGDSVLGADLIHRRHPCIARKRQVRSAAKELVPAHHRVEPVRSGGPRGFLHAGPHLVQDVRYLLVAELEAFLHLLHAVSLGDGVENLVKHRRHPVERLPSCGLGVDLGCVLLR